MELPAMRLPGFVFNVVMSLALAACAGVDGAPSKAPVVEASLKVSGGRSSNGSAKFTDRDNGVLVTVFVTNVRQGSYQLAIHANGNCSSLNFFSAGPAWAPPGSARSGKELAHTVQTNSEGDIVTTFQMPGLRIGGDNGLAGRSVVLHWGRTVDDAQPGVPNNRALCGVVGPVTSFFN
jgi:Cu/Zn superoxide dismutase